MFYKWKNWTPTLTVQFCRWFWIALKTECKILLLYIWSSITWPMSTISYHFLPFSPHICDSLAIQNCLWFPENTLFFVTAVPWHMLAPLPLLPGWTRDLCSLSTISLQYFPPGSFLWPAFQIRNSKLALFSQCLQGSRFTPSSLRAGFPSCCP